MGLLRSARIALAACLLLSFLAIAPSAEAHPYHRQIENPNPSAPDEVNSGRWISQSFAPALSFYVSRVSLYVIDIGPSDILSVSIRPDSNWLPGSTILTEGTVDGPSSGGWLDVDLDPYVPLPAGQDFWIVATSSLGAGAGYHWWNSGNDDSYSGGKGATSPDGTMWSNANKDYTFRIYGFLQPSFSFSADASVAVAEPGPDVMFRLGFSSTGESDAAALWANVTLAGELVYVSDTAASIGGVRSGAYSFEFRSVSPGSYSFDVTTRVRAGVPDGTLTVTRAVFEALDHIGAPLARSIHDVSVTIRNAHLAVALSTDVSFADPGDPIRSDATISNVGPVSATNVTVEARLDPNASFMGASPPGTYVDTARIVRWSFPMVGAGASTNLDWTVRAVPGTRDAATVVSSVRVSYQDALGGGLPEEVANASVRIQAPSFSLVLLLDRTVAETGDEVSTTLHYNNTGSGTALVTWATWHLAGYFELVDLNPAASWAPFPGGFSISRTNVAPGPHSIVARLRVLSSMHDGLSMPIEIAWAATDANGNPLSLATVSVATELLAPSFALAAAFEDSRIEIGSTFILRLTIQSNGRAVGLGWLNLTVPSSVSYESDNSTWASTVSSGSVSWAVPPMLPGEKKSIGIVLRMDGSPSMEAFQFVLSATDERGSAARDFPSNSVSVEFFEAPRSIIQITMIPWWLLAPLIAGLAVSLYFLSRRHLSKAVIEEVFVADQNGLLLSHFSTGRTRDTDQDLVVGMFTAIQQFAREAFSQGHDEMESLQFEERSVMIERGRAHWIALVYLGMDYGRLRARLRRVSEEIDRSYGDLLASWDGDLDMVRGIGPLVLSLWKGGPPVYPEGSQEAFQGPLSPPTRGS